MVLLIFAEFSRFSSVFGVLAAGGIGRDSGGIGRDSGGIVRDPLVPSSESQVLGSQKPDSPAPTQWTRMQNIKPCLHKGQLC